MKKFQFEGGTIRAAGLFSLGPGGRHDWMRFHADEVPCPLKWKGYSGSECPGTLKWKERGKSLKCDICGREFGVRLLVRKTE